MKLNPLIIAHRGESFDAPENTLASINLAWERDANAVEIDVHLSLDNHVMVIHDASTKRTSGIKMKVKNQALSDLKRLDVGSWKNEKFKDERIPTLKEILSTVPAGKKLIIELKSDEKVLPYIKNTIEESSLRIDQVEIISFNYSSVRDAKRMLPDHKILYLADLDYNWYTKLISPSVETLIDKVKKANLDGLDVWAGKLLTKKFAQKVKSAGLLLYVWTVDDVDKARVLYDWGIDGVTTNRAQWLRDKLFNE